MSKPIFIYQYPVCRTVNKVHVDDDFLKELNKLKQ